MTGVRLILVHIISPSNIRTQPPFSVSILYPNQQLLVILLNHLTADEMVEEQNYKLLRYMELAMNPVPESESAVDDFAVHLLSLLGYVPRARMTRTRADTPLMICEKNCHAETDLYILGSDDIILLIIQEDQRRLWPSNPEAQLIAKAIATFQANNFRPRHF